MFICWIRNDFMLKQISNGTCMWVIQSLLTIKHKERRNILNSSHGLYTIPGFGVLLDEDLNRGRGSVSIWREVLLISGRICEMIIHFCIKA